MSVLLIPESYSTYFDFAFISLKGMLLRQKQFNIKLPTINFPKSMGVRIPNGCRFIVSRITFGKLKKKDTIQEVNKNK